MEMKFRQKYYPSKLLEVDKYNRLMDMPYDMVKLYFINDPKVNCLFYLNTIKLPEPVEMYCPDTTLWQKKKIKKRGVGLVGVVVGRTASGKASAIRQLRTAGVVQHELSGGDDD